MAMGSQVESLVSERPAREGVPASPNNVVSREPGRPSSWNSVIGIGSVIDDDAARGARRAGLGRASGKFVVPTSCEVTRLSDGINAGVIPGPGLKRVTLIQSQTGWDPINPY